MVTLIEVDATWVNPPGVQYDAGELRRADAAGFATAGIARGSDDNSLLVSVDGSDVVTVRAGRWVVPGNAVTGSGVWRGGIANNVTGSLDARDATYSRIDLVVVRQLDTDVVSTHTAYTGRVEIITGTPSATPGVPALPSMAVELGRITVPKSGGGAASVDLSHRTFATALGGQLVVPSSAMLPASAPTGQRAYTLDTGQPYRWDGAAWDDGTWKTYVPAWTGAGTNPTLGNSVIQGRYRVLEGKTVQFFIRLTIGSTASATGAGAFYFSLPVSISPSTMAGWIPIGEATLQDVSASNRYVRSVITTGDSTHIAISDDTGTLLTQNVPVSVASSDIITITGSYEKA